MRRLRAQCLALALLAVGCDAAPGGGKTTIAREVVPAPTPVGRAQGTPTSGTIGPAGGALNVAGGAVTLAVPAGSVATSSMFQATAISSYAPGSLATAFRLESSAPLAGPVKITFKGPASYPAGLNVRSLAIRFQDARGFWRAPDAIAYDVGANTVTATTPHLSDWALVVDGAPALDGTFTLAQSVDVPFTATGTAALYAWSTAAGEEPTYFVTGTVTLPPEIASGDDVCVPEAPTQNLELGVAEVHDATFRWGMNARWTLTCTNGLTGAVSSQDVATLFDTMRINLTSCPGDYVGPQANDGTSIEGSYATDCGPRGTVSASWAFRSCTDGRECQPAELCRAGTLACSAGGGTCTATGLAVVGTPCGDGLSCDATGACL
jgi:hypothetical protein